MTNKTKVDFLGSPEKFYGKLRIAGNSLAVTIPKKILEVNGWDDGDQVVVWVKKAPLDGEE